MFLAIELIERDVGNGQAVPHGQFGISDVVLLLLGEFGLVEVGVGELIEVIIDVFHPRLLFCVKPADQVVHGSQVLDDQLVLDVELIMREELGKDVLAHFDNVFGLDEGAVLEAADNQQEDVLAHGLHLDAVDVHPSDFEEASHVFKDTNEYQPKLIQRLLHARLIIDEFLLEFLAFVDLLPLVELRLICSANLHDAFQLVDLGIEDVDLIPDHVVVDVFVELQRGVY
jgi:hypothetical protein